MNEREAVEAFHLAFLQALQLSAGHDRFALKGGGALRFFFGSLRYSEDIDLDVFLENMSLFSGKVTRAIQSPGMERMLKAMDIQILTRNNKVQSPTKEKWEVSLAHPSLEAPVGTRIEMDCRPGSFLSVVKVEPVPTSVMAHYPKLLPPVIGRYLPHAAIGQKIYALKERGERPKGNQERDVFDLDLLFRGWPADARPGVVPAEIAALAAERAAEMSWPAYRSKVVSFLEPSVKEAYDNEVGIWNPMLERVIDKLLELAS